MYNALPVITSIHLYSSFYTIATSHSNSDTANTQLYTKKHIPFNSQSKTHPVRLLISDNHVVQLL